MGRDAGADGTGAPGWETKAQTNERAESRQNSGPWASGLLALC